MANKPTDVTRVFGGGLSGDATRTNAQPERFNERELIRPDQFRARFPRSKLYGAMIRRVLPTGRNRAVEYKKHLAELDKVAVKRPRTPIDPFSDQSVAYGKTERRRVVAGDGAWFGGVVLAAAVAARLFDVGLADNGNEPKAAPQSSEQTAPANPNRVTIIGPSTTLAAPAETAAPGTSAPAETRPVTWQSSPEAGGVACYGADVTVTIDVDAGVGILRQIQNQTGGASQPWAEGDPDADNLLWHELAARNGVNPDALPGQDFQLQVPSECDPAALAR